MITQTVSYTVKPDFVEMNKQNISKFLEDFRKLDPSDFRYNVYLQNNGVTFVHLSTYRNEEIQTKVLNVESFKFFQKERDESGINNTHKVDVLSFVGSSFDVL